MYELSEEAKELRRKRQRDYINANKEKRKIWNKTYWEKQVALEKEKEQKEGGC